MLHSTVKLNAANGSTGGAFYVLNHKQDYLSIFLSSRLNLLSVYFPPNGSVLLRNIFVFIASSILR